MKKICPQPMVWHARHTAMQQFAQERGLAAPPKPLILAGWNFSEDEEKASRWQETERWCVQNGCPELGQGLADEDWYGGT